ncbi:arginase family protein [Herbiconiux daphne]|uniref:Arginase family protein n=1 Tax=Herbiconiux daphne TaxID=2970914 RepID=A0ABT2H219_9MICO|nr:arginase family protein [Herbiconiux daphne]MCS5733998.1 arginase family protein [Herbiconiux daphne]
MPATFVVVPQWQGSGSSRAMRLIDGADAIRGDLPSSATRLVEVPAGAGESLETGVHRFSSLTVVAEAVDQALADVTDVPIVIGGDCGVEFAAIRAAVRRSAGPVAVVWFDAHADLNTPESSPSGAFHGMVLRTLLGGGPAEFADSPVVEPGLVVLAGTRALDDAEADYAEEAGIALISPDRFDSPDAVVLALRDTGATEVYLHVDLDVLDPSEITGIAFPEPFGVTTAQLTAAIRAVREEFTVVGAGITEFAPSTPEAAVDDLPAILRIVSALVR